VTEALNADELRRLQRLDASYDPTAHLLRAGDSLRVAQGVAPYAIELLRRDASGDRERAAAIVEAILDAQMTEPAWDRGRFPMRLPEDWRDLNGTLFLVPDLVAVHSGWRDRLPAALMDRLHKALRMAAGAVERRWADELFDVHRDFKAYSNIFVLYIRCLLLLGRHLEDERLRRDGGAQWRRWFNHVSTCGIDEFCSPTYNTIVFEGLLGILADAADPGMRREVTMVLDFLYVLQHAVTHPLLRLGVVGSSRNYREFVTPGTEGFRFLEHECSDDYRPPAEALREFRNRRYPHRVSGRAGIVPFRFTSWQTPRAAMGSMTGGHYFPQQIHWMAAAGTSSSARAVAFFQADGRSATSGYVRQVDGRALCLFARVPATYHWMQIREAVTGRQDDALPPCLGLTEGWEVRDHEVGRLVVSAFGYALHLKAFSLTAAGLTPVAMSAETVAIRGIGDVRGYRVPEDVTWFVCLAELVGEDDQLPQSVVTGKLDDHGVSVSESQGLSLNLARHGNGGLVELYSDDWRTLPLLDSPGMRLWPGDLAVESLRAMDVET
jgi:hypothetical protein